MKKKTHLLSLLLLFILSNISFAQNELKHPHPIAKEDGFSYRSLMKLLDMDSLYIGSKYENSYHDMLSVLYSRVGRYKEAMRHAEKGYLFRNTMSSAKYYKNVIPVPLSGLMDSIIENNRVIMFNEMHFNPRHRAFVVSWLKKCYDNGYRYLAAETISAKDTLLNERRTVLLGTSGFYSDEPVFGDFLRTAQNIGYDLVPYERTDMNKEREEAQAENLIKNILEKDPDAKFILLGGMGHISDQDGWPSMGRYFREESGIDPFTLDCGVMFFGEQYEGMDSLREAFFTHIDNMQEKEPILVYDTIKNKYISFAGMDATSCLPRTNFIEDNIPDWKVYNGKVLFSVNRRFLKKYGFEEGCVSAFLKSEGTECVPVDQYMYFTDEEEFKLALYKGEYILRFDNGESYKYKEIKVR